MSFPVITQSAANYAANNLRTTQEDGYFTQAAKRSGSFLGNSVITIGGALETAAYALVTAVAYPVLWALSTEFAKAYEYDSIYNFATQTKETLINRTSTAYNATTQAAWGIIGSYSASPELIAEIAKNAPVAKEAAEEAIHAEVSVQKDIYSLKTKLADKFPATFGKEVTAPIAPTTPTTPTAQKTTSYAKATFKVLAGLTVLGLVGYTSYNMYAENPVAVGN